MKKETEKGMSGGKITATAAGIAAIGAGAYYLFGPNAKTHQKKAKILMAKIKNEVAREVKKVKEVTPPLYHKVVDTVTKNYAKQYKLHEKDIKFIAGKLKDEWRDISGKAKRAVNQTKTKVKRVVKKKI